MLLQSFDMQLAKIRSAGIETGETGILRDRIPDVISLSSGAHQPLLIVIPFAVAPFADQYSKVNLGSKKGSYTFLDARLISDCNPQLPDRPYLITDVDDGREALNVSPNDCETRFASQRRGIGTVNQCLAAIIQHPEVLNHHYIQCSGSRIRDERSAALYVPDFYVFARRLKMKREEPDDADPRWGTLSYRDVIV